MQRASFRTMFVGAGLIGLVFGGPGPDRLSAQADPLRPMWGGVATRTLDVWGFQPTHPGELELALTRLSREFAAQVEFERNRVIVTDRLLRRAVEQPIRGMTGSPELSTERLADIAALLQAYPDVRLELRPTVDESEATLRDRFRLAGSRAATAQQWFGSVGVANQIAINPEPLMAPAGVDLTILEASGAGQVVGELDYPSVEAMLAEAEELFALAQRQYRGPSSRIQGILREVFRGAPWHFGILIDKPGEMQTEWLMVKGPERGVWPLRKAWDRILMFTVRIAAVDSGMHKVDVDTQVRIRRTMADAWQKDDIFAHQKEVVVLLRRIDASLKLED